MRKTTADRLTSSDINKVVRLIKGEQTDIVGVLVAIEEERTFDGDVIGIRLHIGNSILAIENRDIETTEISFPCD